MPGFRRWFGRVKDGAAALGERRTQVQARHEAELLAERQRVAEARRARPRNPDPARAVPWGYGSRPRPVGGSWCSRPPCG